MESEGAHRSAPQHRKMGSGPKFIELKLSCYTYRSGKRYCDKGIPLEEPK
jgi:hypothetical protein